MPELLADHTTLRVGGPAGSFVRAESEQDLVAAVDRADRDDVPLLLLAGGSNLVVADEGFPGTVVELATFGVVADADAGADDHGDDLACLGAVSATVAAGESWEDFVALAVSSGWTGVEALSGIPGSVGATPIQNVGAYGQEVAQTIASVRTWDRRERTQRTFAAAECGFGYRTSRFKQDPGRYLVLDVTFLLRQGTLGAPVAYAELARALGVPLGERAPLADVREAVLGLRRAKGMVLDPADHDTWSAGSFFTNPVVPPDVVPDSAPTWPQGDALVKTSAAWLIEHAGYTRGYGGPAARLSTKHTLALTNRGDARTVDLLALAREIRGGVSTRFGIELVNEPVLVGCTL
ncbi:MAG: UDP-N-acetylmuramate dehydrogenase [Marmoricola sp.]